MALKPCLKPSLIFPQSSVNIPSITVATAPSSSIRYFTAIVMVVKPVVNAVTSSCMTFRKNENLSYSETAHLTRLINQPATCARTPASLAPACLSIEVASLAPLMRSRYLMKRATAAVKAAITRPMGFIFVTKLKAAVAALAMFVAMVCALVAIVAALT